MRLLFATLLCYFMIKKNHRVRSKLSFTGQTTIIICALYFAALKGPHINGLTKIGLIN